MKALPAVAAYFAGVQVGTLRQWVRRGHISPPSADGCYDLAEIAEWSERRSQRHALAARHQRHAKRGDRCGSQENV